MNDSQPLHVTVVSVLEEMGIQGPITRTILLENRYFVGYRYHFSAGTALWRARENSLAIFDLSGQRIGLVEMGGPCETKAAA